MLAGSFSRAFRLNANQAILAELARRLYCTLSASALRERLSMLASRALPPAGSPVQGSM
jgi:hypothetical protein